ncbi:MAG: fatty-acid--CoA ligase [Nevskiaceae bacterium]|nr:MAG: fatty-acid--CoA ligase [Nevskiaceae bacterium]TBR74605.1 MAG: fatty-acid--CoA ligase [Nevskiaceae bacterium]
MTQTIVRGCPSTMGDDYQLNTTTLIRHAARTYGEQEIVYRTPDGGWSRYTYADCFERVCRGANALRDLGVAPGDCVGVLAWNIREHFELYWSIPAIAAVMLQMNLRLTPADLGYVVGHSNASLIVVDEALLPVAESIADQVPSVKGWIVISDKPLAALKTRLAPLYHYEDLLAAASPADGWPMVDERSACSACYTTGTTGRPKGVYYSHRAMYLHSHAMATAIGMALDDCTMLITPMFHANCWGLPQAAALVASKIVIPGRYSAAATGELVDTMIREGVTVANGAPVIFQPVLDYIREKDLHPDFHRMRLLSGATEPPLSLMRGLFEETGAEVIQAWGATETTPLVTVNRFKPSVRKQLAGDALWSLKRKQGLPATGIDIKILDASDQEVPHDGETSGEACIRGPWITTTYHGMSDADLAGRFTDDGYWRSGDAATMDGRGYVKLVDRLKDVIKSGGEWISSIDMENMIVALPEVAEAAVIGVPHPKWQERPVAIVALRKGRTLSVDAICAHLSSKFAKWQLPDKIMFVDAIARTSVGKADKKVMRAQYADLYAGVE